MDKSRSIQDVFIVIMKITITQALIMVIMTSLVSATELSGQGILDRKVSIDANDKDIRSILNEIEKQASVTFTYRPTVIQSSKKVSLHVDDARIREVLTDLFGSKVQPVIVEEEILLQPSPTDEEKDTPGENDVAEVAFAVSGKITDEKGEPLPGVNVIEKGTITGTVSDSDGKYFLNVADARSVLVFSFIGFETQETVVNSRSIIDIALNPDIKSLDEVIVVAYSTKKRSELSSSTAVISGQELRDVTSNNVTNLLQGKAPGVIVQNSSGNPNVAANVTIRGSGSISAGSSPLYVVDGIVGGTANPNDIESISVLKDAAAAGLYGSRASNGVIMITTKSGKAGKTRVNFNSSVGFNKASLGNYRMMNSQQLYDFQKSFYDPATFGNIRPASLLNQNTDWLDLVYRTGVTQNYVLTLSGGSEKTQFYLSGVYYNEEGTVRHTDNEEINIRSNLTHHINDKLKVGVRINGITRNFENEASGDYGALAVNTYLPWDNPYNSDGTIKMGTEFINRLRENPLHGWQYNFDKGRALNLYGDVNLDYQIHPNLAFASYNRVAYTNRRSELYYDVRTKPGGGLGILNDDYSYSRKLVSSNRLIYDKSFGNHNFNTIVVFEAETNYWDANSLTGNKIPAGLRIMDAAAVITSGTGSVSENSFNKGLVQVDYNYDNKYFIIGSYVKESSSRFGPKSRSANFYTLGASWMLNKAGFMANLKTFDLLKIRASYGLTGNADIGDYQHFGLYGFTSQYAGNPGSLPLSLGNDELTWEKAKTVNVGLDVGLFNRIAVNLDLYNKRTDGLLLDVPLPNTSGFSSILKNVGSIENKGIEVNVTSKNVSRKNFKWETSFNMSINRNTVLKLNEGKSIPQYLQQISVGHDLYSWYMRKWVGVDPANGDPLWEKVVTDADGNKTVTVTNDYDDATQQFIRRASPNFTGGINNQLIYKAFSLSVFFNFVSGNLVWGTIPPDGEDIDMNGRLLQKGEVRWEKEGDIATEPKLVFAGNKNAHLESSRYLEDGSYIRMRNIRFGYELPQSILSRLRMDNARIFISADNLWTITNFSGMDPEVGLTRNFTLDGDAGNNFQQNSMKYPISKKIMFGINIGF